MINLGEALIARETLVDIATPDGALGCVAFLSARNGVQGAMIDVGNPLADSGWFPLADLDIPPSSQVVINRYL